MHHMTRGAAGFAGCVLAVALASPAAASPGDSKEHLTPQTCSASGGTFSVDKGVRTCTTVTSAVVLLTDHTVDVERITYSGYPTPEYRVEAAQIARFRPQAVVETTTIRSQKGAQPVVEQVSTRQSPSHPDTANSSCINRTTTWKAGESQPYSTVYRAGPLDYCEQLGLFNG